MTPATKSSLFAFCVSAMNWHYFKSTVSNGSAGKSSFTINITGAGLASLFCTIALVFIGRALYRRVRRVMARGVTVPFALPLVQLSPCILLAPLFMRFSYSQTQTIETQTVTYRYGYGADSPTLAFVLCIGLIVVFQLNQNLARYDSK